MYQKKKKGRRDYSCRACVLRISKEKRGRVPVRKFPLNQCGECGAELKGRNSYYCKSCFRRRRYSRWKRLKVKAVEQLGGKCMDCGWEPQFVWEYAAFDFHHRDPATKDPALRTTSIWTLKRADKEVAKCDLLCARCHRIRHAEDLKDTW